MENPDDQSAGNIREHGHMSYRANKQPKPRRQRKLRNIGTSSGGEEEQEIQRTYDPDMIEEVGFGEIQRTLNFDDFDRIEEVGVSEIQNAEDDGETREGNEDENVETVIGDAEGADPIHYETEKPKRRSRKKKGMDIRVLNSIPKTGPFPGGPVDNSVLLSFYEHVSLRVWLGEERCALTIVHHTKKLVEWKLQPGWVRFNEIVSWCGFEGLRDSLTTLDKSLISAFVERWQSDTSSFHMPFGEMTITLDDVKQITSLPIEGELIIGSWEMGYEEGLELVHRCLKVEKSEIKAEFEACKTLSLRNSWIKKQMSGKEDHEDAEVIDASVRGYLLYCIGCTLCPDKSGTKISIAWLRYLEKLEEVQKFAWGAIALAYLYKELNAASRGDRMQIARYLALLEVWIFEHFSRTFSYRSTHGLYVEPQPRMKHWRPTAGWVDADSLAIQCRQSIDSMTEADVIWDPYHEYRQMTRVIPEIAFYEGYLRCMDIKVPHLPNRVLRQFGLVQSMPLRTVSFHGDYFSQWVNHVLAYERRILIQPNFPQCAPGYIEWFVKYSHIRVQNPDKWMGPQMASTSQAPSSSGINVEQIQKAQSILGSIIAKGKSFCGKAYSEVLKARDALAMCGVPPREAVASDEEEASPNVYTRKRKSKKTKK